MRNGIIWLVLAVSILFNVFFVAGYLKALSEQQIQVDQLTFDEEAIDDEQITQMVSRELELTDDQQALFRRLHIAMREDVGTFQANIQLLQQNLIAELQKPDPDLNLIQDIVEEQASLHQQRRQLEAARFGQFVDALNEPQRTELSRKLRPRDRSRRHRELIERFDRDGDGVLNEEERAEAEAYFKELGERRRQEREQMFQELRQRFDVNNDGELDEQERAAMEQWLRENSPRHRGDWSGSRAPDSNGQRHGGANNGATQSRDQSENGSERQRRQRTDPPA